MKLGEDKLVMRPRSIMTILVPIITLVLMIAYDPDPGQWLGLKATGARLLERLFVLSLAWLGTDIVWDYAESDTRHMFRIIRGPSSDADADSGQYAAQRATGAGLAILARVALFGLITFTLLGITGGTAQAGTLDVRTHIPLQCAELTKTLKREQLAVWPAHPDPATLAATAEVESCDPRHPERCCTSKAQLKTSREEGGCFAQITRTYTQDGRQRFDALAEMKRAHPGLLADWTWENVYARDDLCARGLILKEHDDFAFFSRVIQAATVAMDFTVGGYNHGPGNMMKERQLCAMAKDCNPNVYWANVERMCATTTPLGAMYGNRDACSISRAYVREVRQVRRSKYVGLMT